jgi:hypothetical protein
MAIQNFLSGGYYGKLGATVGQRWKNKRTIRTYVVPFNPRTEKQQANRSGFANAVQYAQMGLQMNYYATCFESEYFTRWNYRMRTARDLKSAGLSGLDLIPLYPLTFTPPLLINEITKSATPTPRHITFYVPSLANVGDRTLSLMFELHDAMGVYVGLKLYVGYHYASNAGYLEVDVDDANEINENCKVRIVSNDDEDSVTDLIASPTLNVQPSSIDIRDFNDAIVSVQKTSAGIVVTFAELWKDLATTNEISVTAHFVSNGAQTLATLNAGSLVNNNGYCSVTIPFATALNQNLPAFPSGSDIEIVSINFSGASWQYTKSADVVPYSDTDLIRTLDAIPTWDTSSTADIAFTVPFGGTVATTERSFNMICSGRFNTRTAEAQSFNVSGNGSVLTFTCIGSRKNYPMYQTGDGVNITSFDVVSNGVTYSMQAQFIAVRNAITTSPILETLNWAFYRDGGTDADHPLESLTLSVLVTDYAYISVVSAINDFLEVEVPMVGTLTPHNDTRIDTYEDGDNWYIDLVSNFEFTEHADQVTPSSAVSYHDAVGFNAGGIWYELPQAWLTSNAPSYISGFEE